VVSLLKLWMQLAQSKGHCGGGHFLVSIFLDICYCPRCSTIVANFQANLAVQEANYESAMRDLIKAQAQLDEKQQELDAVRAMYDQAMMEKQASFLLFV